jgi:hypothetical protein
MILSVRGGGRRKIRRQDVRADSITRNAMAKPSLIWSALPK